MEDYTEQQRPHPRSQRVPPWELHPLPEEPTPKPKTGFRQAVLLAVVIIQIAALAFAIGLSILASMIPEPTTSAPRPPAPVTQSPSPMSIQEALDYSWNSAPRHAQETMCNTWSQNPLQFLDAFYRGAGDGEEKMNRKGTIEFFTEKCGEPERHKELLELGYNEDQSAPPGTYDRKSEADHRTA